MKKTCYEEPVNNKKTREYVEFQNARIKSSQEFIEVVRTALSKCTCITSWGEDETDAWLRYHYNVIGCVKGMYCYLDKDFICNQVHIHKGLFLGSIQEEPYYEMLQSMGIIKLHRLPHRYYHIMRDNNECMECFRISSALADFDMSKKYAPQ